MTHRLWRMAVTVAAASAVFALSQLLLAQQRVETSSRTRADGPRDNDPWWKHALVYEVYPRSFGDFWLVCTPPKFTRVHGADIVMESIIRRAARWFINASGGMDYCCNIAVMLIDL
jgi:hypothetical protein